ncbi:MAG: hypothetical protein HY270_19370 [Deltaproteobacteria bacterium]|nr:hypothetical protein [Deltaproteobacteria bacterium]
MAWNIRERKTEHAGAKHGRGAYYGPKAIAKHASNKERRINNRRVVASALGEVELASGLPASDISTESLGADIRMISDRRAYHASRRARRNTRRWCAGKVGRPHQFVLQETLGLNFGLPPLHVWACSRCGRKVYNLKASRHRDAVAVVDQPRSNLMNSAAVRPASVTIP